MPIMTMATSGKNIEDLTGEERQRELRLRYAGAIRSLCAAELRVTAARIVAAYPLTSEEEFVANARDAWREVMGNVLPNARDARHEETPKPSEGKP